MNRWPSRRVFALVLGLFVALGMSLSAVQASDMAVKMALASDMGDAGSHGCTGCGGGDDGAANAGPCLPGCTAPMFAVMPPTSDTMVAQVCHLSLPMAPASQSRASSPDPYPPRFHDLA
jgi:hypothetical protein